MQSIYKTILGILIMVLILYVGISVLWANNEAVAADQYIHTVGNEISTANLQDSVIEACVKQAEENGYVLTYEVLTDSDGFRNSVVLNLKYRYTVLFLSLSGWHEKTLTVY